MAVITARPCVFCNCDSIGVKDSLRDGHCTWAYCSKCGKTGRKVSLTGDPTDSQIIDAAYSAWNQDMNELAKRVEVLKAQRQMPKGQAVLINEPK